MAFTTGKPTFRPKANGNIEDYSYEQQLSAIRTLSDSEKQDPDSKYFTELEVPDYLQEAFDSEPMNPEDAFMPHEWGEKMNNTGHCKVETGYCILPNGVSYAAAMIRQEGVTDEMIDFFNNNFGKTENLFYKCWCPGYHVWHYNNGCLEDFGFGLRSMKFDSVVENKYFGIGDDSTVLENDPNIVFTGMNNTRGYVLSGTKKGIHDGDMIAKYHRNTDYGRELRVRIWYGLNYNEGKYEYFLPEGGQPLEVARCTMRHIILEESRGIKLIKDFWKDNH